MSFCTLTIAACVAPEPLHSTYGRCGSAKAGAEPRLPAKPPHRLRPLVLLVGWVGKRATRSLPVMEGGPKNCYNVLNLAKPQSQQSQKFIYNYRPFEEVNKSEDGRQDPSRRMVCASMANFSFWSIGRDAIRNCGRRRTSYLCLDARASD